MSDFNEPKQLRSLNFRSIVTIIKRRKWLLILPVIIVSGMAYGGTYLLTPMYESSTIVWIDKPEQLSRELVSIMGEDRPSRETNDQRRWGPMEALNGVRGAPPKRRNSCRVVSSPRALGE